MRTPYSRKSIRSNLLLPFFLILSPSFTINHGWLGTFKLGSIFLQLPVLEDLWDIDMCGSMLQLPGRLLAIAGFQGEIQLSGQVLLKILAAGLRERNEVGEFKQKTDDLLQVIMEVLAGFSHERGPTKGTNL